MPGSRGCRAATRTTSKTVRKYHGKLTVQTRKLEFRSQSPWGEFLKILDPPKQSLERGTQAPQFVSPEPRVNSRVLREKLRIGAEHTERLCGFSIDCENYRLRPGSRTLRTPQTWGALHVNGCCT